MLEFAHMFCPFVILFNCVHDFNKELINFSVKIISTLK